MSWTDIERVIGAYQGSLESALVRGDRPYPMGLAMTKKDQENFEIVRTAMTRHATSSEDVRSLAEKVRIRTRDCDAAGMVALLPRSVAFELIGRKDPEDPLASEHVGFSHAEHLTSGVRTWILEIPNMVPVGEWILVNHGIRSKLPTFIDNRRYTAGGTA